MKPGFKLVYMVVITIIWIYCINAVFKTTLWQLGATFVAFFLLIPGFKRDKQNGSNIKR